ncbi:MAG: glycoside hydrolase family 2 TIM barrel-domain containing protein [Draconibacterium sp.]
MNLKYGFVLVIFFLIITQLSIAQRVVNELGSGWKFAKGSNEQAFLPDFNDATWQTVEVPHDWAIEGPFDLAGNGSTGKLPWKGEGWYRKNLEIPAGFAGKTVYLLFDGVMAFPQVYVNGQLAGKWDYGYNSFYLDITKLVQPGGKNLLAVYADTRNHDSRWYPGAGIYRKVQLIAVNPVHVDIWGTYITTSVIKPHMATVQIETSVKNNNSIEKQVVVKQTIFNKKGKIVGETNENVAVSTFGNKITSVITLLNPERWEPGNPVLYSVKTEILENNQIVDTYETPFGVRDIRITPDDGLYVNDKRVQLKGVNLHHDLGALGAAFNYRAMQRQLEIMQEMGCNAVRTSHNSPAPELLDLCDKMGLLVIDEVFDKYDKKADITDTTNFEDFARRNIRNFVVRDRNHPSIFLWSVGNEMGDVQWDKNGGFDKLKTMLKWVEHFDSTRLTTMVCDSKESAKLRHFDFYDVHCWNYGRRYNLAREMEPGKSVIISESASTLSTRGFYEFPLPTDKTKTTKSLQVSSYDLHAPYWAEIADDDFMWQQDEPYVAGEFVWTGFDYLGEPEPYTNMWAKQNGLSDSVASRSSYFGIVDLNGIPKDRYFLYKSYWNSGETTIHILPHWNWPERVGQNVPVFVYTNGDCAELFLNGKSLGKKCKNPESANSTKRFRLMWNEVIYQPGELKVVAYKEGEKIGESIVKTTGEPVQLRLTPDRTKIAADGKDLSFVLIEALDKDGNVCPLADNNIKISLSGNATLAGIDNGSPQSFSSFKSDNIKLFYGKAMVIIKSAEKAGTATVAAVSDGLKNAETTLEIQ